MKPIRSEHSFSCELWLDGGWVPGSVYRKLTDQWCGVLRVETVGEGEPRVWETEEAQDFEEDFLELFAGSTSDDPRYGPALRMPIELRVRTDEGVVYWRGMYELGIKDSSWKVPWSYVSITFDGDMPTLEDADLSRIIDQLSGAECCGRCQFGAHSLYGGGDTMFGLHCFRDAKGIMADRALYIEAAQDMSQVAHPHTPLLHWCPSFQQWDSEYQKWTAENPPDFGKSWRESQD